MGTLYAILINNWVECNIFFRIIWCLSDSKLSNCVSIAVNLNKEGFLCIVIFRNCISYGAWTPAYIWITLNLIDAGYICAPDGCCAVLRQIHQIIIRSQVKVAGGRKALKKANNKKLLKPYKKSGLPKLEDRHCSLTNRCLNSQLILLPVPNPQAK